MLQLWDKKRCRPVYTTCIQPVAPYRRKRSHLKVRCVTKNDGESYSLVIASVASWVMFIATVIRWWNS